MSILIILALTLLSARADQAPLPRKGPNVVLLTIEDGYIVQPKAVKKLERLLTKFNRGAHLVTIHASGREWTKKIDRAVFSPEPGSSVDNLVSDFSSIQDSIAARVRARLGAAVEILSGPIDQLVVFAPVLGEVHEGVGEVHILGLGAMNGNGFDPDLATALSPVRHRLAKDASIVLLGGHPLGPSAEANERLASRALDFFGAPEGRFFGLRASEDEAQSIELRPNLLRSRMLLAAVLAGGVATMAWAGGYIDWAWIPVATVATSFNLNGVLVGIDYLKKMPRYLRQTKFGLHFKGWRIEPGSEHRPLEMGRDEREILSCAERLES